MEQLIQKYIRYFYLTLILGISMQLISTIITTLKCEIKIETFVLMFLSIANLILLFNNMRHNMKQQFTECKLNSKILRYSLGLLLAVQALICYSATNSVVMLLNHAMMIGVVEIILNYRIKTIEHLEQLVSKYKLKSTIDQKGDVNKCQV